VFLARTVARICVENEDEIGQGFDSDQLEAIVTDEGCSTPFTNAEIFNTGTFKFWRQMVKVKAREQFLQKLFRTFYTMQNASAAVERIKVM